MTQRQPGWALAAVAFAVLATANAAGYRYGGADQAFYIPAIVKTLHPEAFPRDSALIGAQGGLILFDDLVGWVARTTGASLETIFVIGYLVSLAITWAGLVLIGTRVYASTWLTLALGAAFTMRHRIPRTSANSFEPYFHPRMIAFAIALLAVGAFLRRRPWTAIALVGAAAVFHVTTALWFAILLGVAIPVVDRRFRPVAYAGTAIAALFLTWAVTAGPLQASLAVMDDVWLRAVASKDSLFADEWPLWAWLANFSFLAVLWWAHRVRVRRGVATAEDGALVWGSTALVAFFLLTMPAVLARLSFVVEFQISRVFWVVDLLATVYAIAAIAAVRPLAGRVLATVMLALSVVRSGYVMFVEHPERALFATHIEDSAWEDAMRWLKRQPADTHVLADPGHAWKYGTSVRVSAERDVFLEDVKDSALAIYSRDVAARVVDRTAALGDFSQLSIDTLRHLASEYDLHYLVTTAEMPLSVAYQNTRFRIYSLR